jgi:hypothetical protein
METLTMRGTYRDGTVELDEVPADWPSPGRVQVIFQPDTSAHGPAVEPTLEEREAARQRLLALFAKGISLGGPPYPTREELHDRFESRDGIG